MASMVDVKNYFGYDKIGEFRSDWNALTESDKAQLKQGIEDGTLTY